MERKANNSLGGVVVSLVGSPHRANNVIKDWSYVLTYENPVDHGKEVAVVYVEAVRAKDGNYLVVGKQDWIKGTEMDAAPRMFTAFKGFDRKSLDLADEIVKDEIESLTGEKNSPIKDLTKKKRVA